MASTNLIYRAGNVHILLLYLPKKYNRFIIFDKK